MYTYMVAPIESPVLLMVSEVCLQELFVIVQRFIYKKLVLLQIFYVKKRMLATLLKYRHTVKKVSNFPVPSRVVTNKTLPDRENLIISGQGEFG